VEMIILMVRIIIAEILRIFGQSEDLGLGGYMDYSEWKLCDFEIIQKANSKIF